MKRSTPETSSGASKRTKGGIYPCRTRRAYYTRTTGNRCRETLQQILENPYLQYFLGLPEYQHRRPFHASLMTHFRKRLCGDIIHEVNEWIALEESRKSSESQDPSDDDDPQNRGCPAADSNPAEKPPEQIELTNEGELLLDATCTPAHIVYPTDLSLLNQAREKLEHIIDILHEPERGKSPKSPTYRQMAVILNRVKP